MIIKAKSRAGPSSLAAHLGNAEKNERVQVLETRGTVAQDLRGALIEMDAYAAGSRCAKPLYHAAISPEPPHRLTPEQRIEAVDALEKKLGLDGHARTIVLHEKHGREHIHVVWSRIDLNTMRAVHDGHNYRKHEEVARDLERRFGHERVQGAHHERDGVERPDRTPSRAELRQEERTGITGKQVKEQVSALFRASDGPEAFKSALLDNDYILANGDRRDFVIVDRAGGIHSLARRIDTMKAADLEAFMQPLDRTALPDVEAAKAIMAEKSRVEREADEERAYSRGGDYVSQSRAAQKEHERRQDELDDINDRDDVWERITEGEARREERERSEHASQDEPTQASESKSLALGDIELTDAMQTRLDQLLDSGGLDPGRQSPAPGGGRTRSR